MMTKSPLLRGWGRVFTCMDLRQQLEEKKRKREKVSDVDAEVDEFQPGLKVEVEQHTDRPVRACRTQQGERPGPWSPALIHQ